MQHDGHRLEVICGSMFSGKSEELIRRVRRARFAKQKVQVFKPSTDQRPTLLRHFHESRIADNENAARELALERAQRAIASHDGLQWDAFMVDTADDVLAIVDPDTEVVGIDEVQFFGEGAVLLCEALADRRFRVIVAGLDQDFRGEPFQPMPELMARAESVVKLQAICVVCAAPASRSQRLINGKPAAWHDPVIMVGADEVYEARCRRCHVVVDKPGPACELDGRVTGVLEPV